MRVLNEKNQKNIIIWRNCRATFLSSCTSETKQELAITHTCNDTGTICSIEFGAQNVTYTKNLTGKDLVLNREILRTDNTSLVWTGITNFATNTDLTTAGLTNCATSPCTNTQNPTGGEFTADETVNITVSGTITINGQQIQINQTSGGTWIVPMPPAPATVTFTKPTGWVGDSTGSLGTSGITFSISGDDVTFTCPQEYPKIPTRVTNLNPAPGELALVSGTSQRYAQGGLNRYNDNDFNYGSTVEDQERYITINRGNPGTSDYFSTIVCVASGSDWTAS